MDNIEVMNHFAEANKVQKEISSILVGKNAATAILACCMVAAKIGKSRECDGLIDTSLSIARTMLKK